MTPSDKEIPRFDPPMPDDTRRVLLDVLREQVHSQDKQFESLRMVASILLATGGVVLTAFFAADVTWGHPVIAVMLFGSAGALVVSLSAGVWVAWPAKLYRNPKPKVLLKEFAHTAAKDLEEELVKQFERSYTGSEPTLKRMGVGVKVSALFLVLAILALLAVAAARWSVASVPQSQMSASTRATVPIADTLSLRRAKPDSIAHGRGSP